MQCRLACIKVIKGLPLSSPRRSARLSRGYMAVNRTSRWIAGVIDTAASCRLTRSRAALPLHAETARSRGERLYTRPASPSPLILMPAGIAAGVHCCRRRRVTKTSCRLGRLLSMTHASTPDACVSHCTWHLNADKDRHLVRLSTAVTHLCICAYLCAAIIRSIPHSISMRVYRIHRLH